MNLLVLYLLLLKATLTSFTGPSSLPVVREDFVENRHVMNDAQLSAAVAIGRSTPGPNGIYVVSVGYFAAGIPGAAAGWMALITPALVILALLRLLGERAKHPTVRAVIDAVIIASVGLVVATIPRLASALQGELLGYLLLIASFLALVLWKANTALVVGLASLVMAMATLV